jgi:hypothetical protein
LGVAACDCDGYGVVVVQLGVTTALINTNLNGKPLEHVLKVSQARTLIIGPEQLDHFETTRQTLKTVDEGEWSVWVFQGREATAPNPLAWQWAKDMDVRLSAHDEYNTPSSLRAGVRHLSLSLRSICSFFVLYFVFVFFVVAAAEFDDLKTGEDGGSAVPHLHVRHHRPAQAV